MKLGVLDYGAGNLRSVLNAFAAIETHAELVTGPADFDGIDVLVFPGQGAFGDSVRILKERGLWQPLKDWLASGKPYFGICLGYQLLFESSEESPGVEGLAVAKGIVRKFDPASGLKIPHMGWNRATSVRPHGLTQGLEEGGRFYFVHSYHFECIHAEDVLLRTTYGYEFTSGVQRGNVMGVQFHPEKSHRYGMQLIRNFVGL